MADDKDTPILPAIISRAEAKAAGLNRYFTGRPCKNGHIAEHHIAGGCLACRPAQQRALRAANREKISERRASRYATDPEYAEKVRSRSRRYREENPEKVKATTDKWRSENKEEIAAYNKARYWEDPEKSQAMCRRWRDANRERIAEYARARYAADPEKHRAQSRKYAAANPEKVKARAKAWDAANVERRKALNAAWLAANRERKRATAAAWREANREKYREMKKAYGAAYYAVNRERIKASGAKYRAENLERGRANSRAWRAANPEQARLLKRLSQARRRARAQGSGGSHTAEDIQRIYKAQKGKCAFCREKVGADYHVDHIQPLSKGGSNLPANLQILCPPCNQAKKAKDPIDYARSLGLLL